MYNDKDLDSKTQTDNETEKTMGEIDNLLSHLQEQNDTNVLKPSIGGNHSRETAVQVDFKPLSDNGRAVRRTPPPRTSNESSSAQAKRKPAEPRAVPQKPAESRAVPQKPAESRAVPQKPAEQRTISQKPAESRTIPQKPAEPRAVPQKPAEPRAVPQKPAESRAVPQKPEEQRTIPQRTRTQRTPQKPVEAENVDKTINTNATTTTVYKNTAHSEGEDTTAYSEKPVRQKAVREKKAAQNVVSDADNSILDYEEEELATDKLRAEEKLTENYNDDSNEPPVDEDKALENVEAIDTIKAIKPVGEDKIAKNEPIVINIKDFLLYAVKSVHIIALFAILSAFCSYIITEKFIQSEYVSNTKIIIFANEQEDADNITSLDDMQFNIKLMSDCSQIIKSRDVLEIVIDELNLDIEYEELYDDVTVEITDNSRIVDISVKYTDPIMTVNIISKLQEISLQSMKDNLEVTSARVIQYENLPREAVSPSLKKNLVFGGCAGIVLAIIVLFGFYVSDLKKGIHTSDN